MKKLIAAAFITAFPMIANAQYGTPPTIISKATTDAGLVITNVRDRYDSWKGQYHVYFTVTNKGKKTFQILQVNGSFYIGGKQVGTALTGNKLGKGQSVQMDMGTIIPEGKPNAVTLSVDMDASFYK